MLDINLKPSDQTLRQFGFIAFAVFCALAVCAWFGLLMFHFSLGGARLPVTVILVGIACLSGMISLAYPRANRYLYLALTIIAYPIGIVVSHVILLILYFGVLTPTGLLLRIFGRDPMSRRFATNIQSYWHDVRPNRDRASYFRQS